MPDKYDASGNRIKEELIRGEIVGMPTPSRWHDIIKNKVSRVLAGFLEAHPDVGLDAYIEIAYAVNEENTFVPDVSVIQESRAYAGSDRIITRAPEIAIEVVSPSETVMHLKAKIAAYLANGSRSVWVVFPDDKSIEIHTAQDVREVRGSQPIQDEMLPGFSEPVSRFFEGL